MKRRTWVVLMGLVAAMAASCDSDDSSADENNIPVGLRLCTVTDQGIEVVDFESIAVQPSGTAAGDSYSVNLDVRGSASVSGAVDVALWTNTAIVAVAGVAAEGLVGFDLLDPDNPVQIGALDMDSPLRLRIRDASLYVAQGNKGLSVLTLPIDFSYIETNHFVFDADDLGNPISVKDVEADGAVLYLATDHGLWVLQYVNGTFTELAHDPSTVLTSCRLGVNKNLLFCTGAGLAPDVPAMQPNPRGLMIYDVSEVDSPQLISATANSNVDLSTTLDFATSGTNQALVVEQGMGLAWWDISSLEEPVRTDLTDMPWPDQVKTEGSWAFVTSRGVDTVPHQGSGVHIFSFGGTVPAETYAIGHITPTNDARVKAVDIQTIQ